MRLVACGLSDRQIAGRLALSEATVQRRLRSASSALRADSRVRVVVRAIALGYIRIEEVDPIGSTISRGTAGLRETPQPPSKGLPRGAANLPQQSNSGS